MVISLSMSTHDGLLTPLGSLIILNSWNGHTYLKKCSVSLWKPSIAEDHNSLTLVLALLLCHFPISKMGVITSALFLLYIRS